jgi:hypothetical protein
MVQGTHSRGGWVLKELKEGVLPLFEIKGGTE